MLVEQNVVFVFGERGCSDAALWKLVESAKWLRAWTLANESGAAPELPSPAELFPFVFNGKDRVLQDCIEVADPVGWHRYAPLETSVRFVSAHINAKPKAKKRKADKVKAGDAEASRPASSGDNAPSNHEEVRQGSPRPHNKQTRRTTRTGHSICQWYIVNLFSNR